MITLDRFPILRSSDPDEAYDALRLRHPSMYGFAAAAGPARPWSVRLNFIAIGGVKITAVDTRGHSIAAARDGYVRMFLPQRLGLGVEQGRAGRRAEAGGGRWAPPEDYRLTFDPGAMFLSVSLPVADLAPRLDGLQDLGAAVTRAFLDAGDRLALFRAQLSAALSAFDADPPGMIFEERFKRAQEELLLIYAAQSLLPAGAEAEAAKAPHAAVLRRALDFIEACLTQEIGPSDIARQAGCSPHTLQRLFRRALDTTLTGYIRRRRLLLARERLLRPLPGDTAVSVAYDCGFAHLGEFARRYCLLFGERPTQTLMITQRGGV